MWHSHRKDSEAMKTDKYSRFRRNYSHAKQNAAEQGLEFNLNLQQLYRKWLRQKGKCSLTGVELQFGRNDYERSHGYTTASIDRKNSEQGYTIKNVQWVHKDINAFKSNYPNKTFKDMCFDVAYYTANGEPLEDEKYSS